MDAVDLDREYWKLRRQQKMTPEGAIALLSDRTGFAAEKVREMLAEVGSRRPGRLGPHDKAWREDRERRS